jgi:hypothetical protein
MLFTRTRKRWIAVTAVALVAFAHAAIAVSGCLSSTMPATESGCDEHQSQSPADSTLLCRTHLQAETQTLDLANPQVLHFDAPVLTLALGQALVPAGIAVAVAVRLPRAGAPPPPLNLLFSRSLT